MRDPRTTQAFLVGAVIGGSVIGGSLVIVALSALICYATNAYTPPPASKCGDTCPGCAPKMPRVEE